MTRENVVPAMPWLPPDMGPVDRKEAEDNWEDIHLRIADESDTNLRMRTETLRNAIIHHGSDTWMRYWKASYAVLLAEVERRRLRALERTDCLT